MRCPYCDKSIWFKMEVKDNGVSVVLPFTVEQIADRLIEQRRKEGGEKNGNA